MLGNSIKAQMSIMFKKKAIWITFYVLLILVLGHYLINVLEYQGYDVIYLPHPAKLLLISNSVMFGDTLKSLFFQLYPLIVILPAGFSLAQDYDSRESVFIYSRVGGMNYYMGKMIATFMTTFLIFVIPLLIQLLMNFVTYPIKAIGEATNIPDYTEAALWGYDNYLYGSIEVGYPYLAALIGICMLGITSGILANFTIAISSFKVPFKVLLFLPVYVLLFGLVQLDGKIANFEYKTNYSAYLSIFNTGTGKSCIGFIIILFILLLFSFIVMYQNGRKGLL